MAGTVITLTTDFGTRDAYVAAMKGVILGINPQTAIVDVSHQVPPQDVAHAAFLLGSVYPYYPNGTIHVAVVDPGVGTARKTLLLATPRAFLLAPDNGVLTYVLKENGAGASGDRAFMEPVAVLVPPACAAYELTVADYWLHPVSTTFHGRDVLAPVAAHLSRGVAPHQLGTPVERVLCLNIPGPAKEGNRLAGRIIHIDHFGNLVSNIAAVDLPEGPLEIRAKGHSIGGLSTSYADGEGLLAVVGSHGYLEIAVRNGSATALLNARVGDEVEALGQG